MDRVTVTALFDVHRTIATALLEELTYPWAALPRLGDFIVRLGETLPPEQFEQTAADVWIARSARVSSQIQLSGPCIIDEQAEIRSGAAVRGRVILGKQAVIGHFTEVKNALLFDRVKAAHGNYIGDTVAGYAAHFGAGAATDNLRDDRFPVVVKVGDTLCETGLRKVGAVLGDGAEIGCNSVLCPGSILGKMATVSPLCCVEGFVPAFHRLQRDGVLSEKPRY